MATPSRYSQAALTSRLVGRASVAQKPANANMTIASDARNRPTPSCGGRDEQRGYEQPDTDHDDGESDFSKKYDVDPSVRCW